MTKTNKPAAQVLSSRTVFRGRVFYVTSDHVVEPGGIRARRDTVCHQGSVVILAVDESGNEPRVLLVRQYRYPAKDYLWELPAGRIDEGESELAGAKRELREETGYSARHWKRALFFYPSPGFLSETMALYLARGLTAGKAEPDSDEMISTRFFPLSRLVSQVLGGQLRDGKTIVGVLWLARLLSGRQGRA
jgi:ADP-ribose pyrophosphatase